MATVGGSDGAEPAQIEERPVHEALAVEDGVGQFDGARTLTEEGLMEQLARMRALLGDGPFAEVMLEQRKLTHPRYVGLDEITRMAFFPKLLEFLSIASGSAVEPAKSYEQLKQIILDVGLVPELVLSEVSEERWITPGTTRRQPGQNRHSVAWAIFLNMLRYLARVCCYGTDCPGLVSFEKLTAFSLSGVHFDHKDPEVKSTRKNMLKVFEGIGCKWLWDGEEGRRCRQRAEAAAEELRGCQVLCAGCHDIGENKGRDDTAKRGAAASRLS
jgi:hypothetical protein